MTESNNKIARNNQFQVTNTNNRFCVLKFSLQNKKVCSKYNAFIKFFVHFIKQGWENAATRSRRQRKKNKSSCFFGEEFY